MLNPHIRQYICKNTKNIQKVDYMDGFCWQSELDLTLFYKIEGDFDNLKSLMTGNDRDRKRPLSSYRGERSILFYPMQLVTPSVVAIAVRMLMAICRIVFQVFAFIFFEC